MWGLQPNYDAMEEEVVEGKGVVALLASRKASRVAIYFFLANARRLLKGIIIHIQLHGL